MSILSTVFGPLLDTFNGWRGRKHEIKMAEHQLAVTKAESKVKIEEARATAEANVLVNRSNADINWELESIRNSGWKDEYLTIFTTIIVLAAFIPVAQDFVADGFDVLTNNTPVWFQIMVSVVYSSAFGVRVFDRYQSLIQTRRAKE